ncbi:MAG: toll/interleukin-1 receptor domain-containing protein [Candidatus Electrothrix sp. ATG2]|nr:toll/interleukin-1 receptor domain-containing protein [Candidatus Electrothrix sp. ATG2]
MQDNRKQFINNFAPDERHATHRYYDRSTVEAIEALLSNRDDCIINIFGQSGSGKTSTIEVIKSRFESNHYFMRIRIAQLLRKCDSSSFLSCFANELHQYINSNERTPYNKKKKNKISVFLSYARSDYKKVSQYYRKLNDDGFNPWIDKKRLHPGQDWKYVIEKELQKATFVILFISKELLTKRGYIQDEIKQALLYKNSKLPDDVYFIPARLEECDIPSELSECQYVDLFTEDGYDTLVNALIHGCNKLGLDFNSKVDNVDLNASSNNDINNVLYRLTNFNNSNRLVLILDDFNYLFHSGFTKKLLNELGEILYILKSILNCQLVFISHRDIRSRLIKINSNFKQEDIKQFDLGHRNHEELVGQTQNLLDQKIQIDNKTLNRLVRLSGGNYYCRDIIFNTLIEYLEESGYTTFNYEDIHCVINKVVTSSHREDFRMMWSYIPIALRLFVTLCLDKKHPERGLNANGFNADLVEFFNEPEINSILNYLVANQYIVADRSTHKEKYRITIPIVAYWLSETYREAIVIYKEFAKNIIGGTDIAKFDYSNESYYKKSIAFTESKEVLDSTKI